MHNNYSAYLKFLKQGKVGVAMHTYALKSRQLLKYNRHKYAYLRISRVFLKCVLTHYNFAAYSVLTGSHNKGNSLECQIGSCLLKRQGNLIQEEESDSFKTALETRRKTA